MHSILYFDPIPSDRSLDLLAISMWSTMIFTSSIFISIMVVFLSVRVGKSISHESKIIEQPLELSFLFSTSGFRYLWNHVRHHLFETPLLPRRRYSSLSKPTWFSNILKRASFTYFSSFQEILHADDSVSAQVPASLKNRRSSSSDSFASQPSNRRVAHKPKRMSVPSVISGKSLASRSDHDNPTHVPVAKSEPKTNVIDTKAPVDSAERLILPIRRNTITNILNYSTVDSIPEELPCSILDEDNAPKSLAIIEEELSDHLEAALSEYEYEDGITDDGESLEDALIEEASSSEEQQEIVYCKDASSSTVKAIDVNVPSRSANVSNSPGQSSSLFRSSYFNYLPESIFGYTYGSGSSTNSVNNSNNVVKQESHSSNAQHPSSSCNVPIPSVSRGVSNNGLAAPPGFSKRGQGYECPGHPSLPATDSRSSASLFNTAAESPPDTYINHQPLYARRRMASLSASNLNTAASSSFALNASAPHYEPMASTVSSRKSLNDISTAIPNRSANASPSLSDLNNTEDLFAPINWNFSSAKDLQRSDSIRRRWEEPILEEEASEAVEYKEMSSSSQSENQNFTSQSGLGSSGRFNSAMKSF